MRISGIGCSLKVCRFPWACNQGPKHDMATYFGRDAVVRCPHWQVRVWYRNSPIIILMTGNSNHWYLAGLSVGFFDYQRNCCCILRIVPGSNHGLYPLAQRATSCVFYPCVRVARLAFSWIFFFLFFYFVSGPSEDGGHGWVGGVLTERGYKFLKLFDLFALLAQGNNHSLFAGFVD